MVANQQLESHITTLERSVEAGLAYFQGLEEQGKLKAAHWGPREVLCQLVWWHQATAEGMESVLSGGAPYRIYASVDEMNARAVGRLSGKTVGQLAELTRQFQARIAKAARALPNQQAIVLILGDGSKRSAQQRLEAIAQHWDERVRELQAQNAA
jgi:hypothetical protein